MLCKGSLIAACLSVTLAVVTAIVYFDAIVAKVRDDGKVSNRAIYLALGVNMLGHKEVLGMWPSVLAGGAHRTPELRIARITSSFPVSEVLSGFPEAIERVSPQTRVQLCVVHMLRNSFKFVGWKERKEVAAELKNIYCAPTADDAKDALLGFRELYDERFPAIGKSWEANWQNLIPFFAKVF